MRASAAQRTGAHGEHLCWTFIDRSDFLARAALFLTAGMSAGHRLEYIGSGSIEGARAELETVSVLARMLASGDLSVRSIGNRYGPAAEVDPFEQVDAYAEETRDSMAQGHTGLRVVADATDLVRTPAQRAAFARYEHLIDRYMLTNPFFAMCGYDARALGRQTVAEIACLHPEVRTGATAFQWHAAAGTDLALSGEIDLSCRHVFDATVARTIPLQPQRRFTVDARGLRFIDHRGLLVLEQRAKEAEAAILMRSDAPVVHRLARLLQLDALRVE